MHNRLWLVASVLLPAALIGGTMLVSSRVGYNRWDNLEQLLPAIWFNHNQLLNGEFPRWNQHQHMGQPAHAQGIGGALYPGYTLCTLIVELSGVGSRALLGVIAVLHAMLAGPVLYLLLRDLTVRPALALVGALSVVMSGPVLLMSSVWIWVAPYQAWSAIALFAVVRIVDQPRRTRWLLLCALALAMFFHIGHGQWAVYCCLVTGLVALGYAIVQHKLRPAAVPLLIAAVSGALLAMPSVLPTLDLLADSDRAADLSLGEFSYRGVTREALLGLLLPIFRGKDGFSGEPSLYTTYLGAWVIPAIFVMLAEAFRRKRDHMVALSLLFFGIGALLLVLSMGAEGGIYPWTYGVPIWSRFRWPFKLLPRAAPLLVIGGSLALEVMARRPFSWSRGCSLLAGSLLLLLLWIVRPAVVDVGAVCAAAVGLACVVLLAWLHRPQARAVLLMLTLLASVAMLLQTHRPGRFKAYDNETIGQWTGDAFGIDTNYRVLPLSHALPANPIFQEAGLFDAATLNGYFSLTGTHTPLSSTTLAGYLPTTTEGTLERHYLATFANSHLLRGFNVKYLIVLNEDQPTCELLDQMPQVTELKRTPNARIYEYRDAMPRAWFASEIRTGSDEALMAGLINNEAPPDCAYVYADVKPGPAPVGQVDAIDWGHNRVAMDITAPAGGFLVVSMTYARHWRATVDGREASVHRVNGPVMGISVPSGAGRIELHYDAAPLRRGMLWAAGGILLLMAFAAHRATIGSKEKADDPPGPPDAPPASA